MSIFNSIPNEITFGFFCGLAFFVAGLIYAKINSRPRNRKFQQKQYHYDYRKLIPKQKKEQKPNGESLEMRHLLHMLLHDRKAAERLIAYEKELDPSLTREECIREAIARIRRDQRA